MKRTVLFTFLFLTFAIFAQDVKIVGKITDQNTSEGLIGASVQYAPGKGTVTNFDGEFELLVPKGEYELTVTYSGYVEQKIKVNAKDKINTINVGLSTIELDEVEVIGNIATDRETPVAITQITKEQITEELASQDLPMVLNGTPGVQATQTGGGDGDARITIRGFTQRNVAVMIDGVPVNDMENGWVYWSNWFGLDAITQRMQVQRGLGATKIANPAVGGSLNILTQGIDNDFSVKFKQELGTGWFSRTSFSYNSGMLKGKWGITIAGSFKRGDGWVDGTPTLGGFYYAKIQKRFKRHTLSLSAFGAPQQHGQRSYKKRITYWDADYAKKKFGYEEVDAPDHGLKYNEHWGYRTVDGERKLMNERKNYFHKPQVTLKDFWNINEKVSWSNIAYVSIGRGGGTAMDNYGATKRDEDGQIDFDQIVFDNQNFVFGNDTFPNNDALYHPTKYKANQFIRSSVNNHFWAGFLSTIDYRITKEWKFNAGADYRFYQGEHYKEAYDLLGGDYVVSNVNQNSPYSSWEQGSIVGDDNKYRNLRDGLVQWVGAFAQTEFSNKKWTWFVNLSGVYSGYKGIDYFLPMQVSLEDTTLNLAYGDTVSYNGKTYTQESEEAENHNTGWIWKPGFTFKTGANYNINKNHNVFVNVGYLSRTPQFSNVVNTEGNNVFESIKNEEIMAAEFGYGFRSKKFSMNINGYYTYWNNKPFPFGYSIPDPNDPLETIKVNINGMAAQHMGAELDFVWKIIPQLELQGVVSYGDWTWQSQDTVNVQGNTVSFDARGVHVGDAAQSIYGLSLRYEFVKRAYIKVRYTIFDRYYSDFDPFSLNGANAGRESWRLPTYGLMDLHVGYSFRIKKKYGLSIRGSLLNVLNTKYISDAQNNGFDSPTDNFDAQSADVFFGQGIRWNFSIAFQIN